MGNSCGCGKTLPPEVENNIAPEPIIPEKPPRRPSLQVALDRYELADKNPPGSEHRMHRCTDCSCCLFFAVALALLGWILVYAEANGDPRKLHHGVDYHGHICGVHPDVADKPFLYWCAATPPKNKTGTAAGNETEASNPEAAGDLPEEEGGAEAPPPEEEPGLSGSLTGNMPGGATGSVAIPGGIIPTAERRRRLSEGLAEGDVPPTSAQPEAPEEEGDLPPEGGEGGEGDEQPPGTTAAPKAGEGGRNSSGGEPVTGGDPINIGKVGGQVHEWLHKPGRFKLNLRYPMCVPSCPATDEEATACFNRRSPVEKEVLDNKSGTYQEKTVYHFRIVEDYPTKKVAHYCLPSDIGMRQSLGGVLDDSQEALMFHLSEIRHATPCLATTVVFAVILGFAYLCLLGLCPGCLIFLTFAGSVLIPLIAGALSLWGWYMEDEQGQFLEQHGELKVLQLPATGDSNKDLIVSVVLILVGLIVAMIACCNLSSIRLSVRSVDAACECLMAVPSLLFEPFINVVVQVCAMYVLGRGLLQLVSCGEVSHMSHISLTYMHGVSRSFVYQDMEYIYLVLYVLIGLWAWEFTTAMQKFAIAYATQLWYFAEYRNNTKYMPSCSMLQGICIGLSYHMGTLALGALCIPPFRIAHWVHSAFLRPRPGAESDEEGGGASECLVSCCTCCWACWEGFMKFMHSNSYIVVAIDSYPFYPASQKAYNSDLYQVEQLGDPNGFMWVFQLWGVLVISGLSAAFTWCVATTFDDFTKASSPHYIENPVPITTVGAVIGGVIGLTFMHVLSNIADTIVFCYAMEREWYEDHGQPMRNNVPRALEAYLTNAGHGARAMYPPRGSRRASR